MSKKSFSKRVIYSLFVGLISVIFINITSNITGIFVSRHALRIAPPGEFMEVFRSQKYVLVFGFLALVRRMSPFVGGFIVGRITKQNGLKYGSLFGVIIKFLEIFIYLIILMIPMHLIYGDAYPSRYGHSEILSNILNLIIYSPITIVLAAFGGYIGEKFRKK